jgi:CRP-like cAMP-binding protein
MISPEVLRRYPFFGSLTDAELRAIAMIAEEESLDSGVILFNKGKSADALYFLQEGRVELYYPSNGDATFDIEKGILVADINIGEPFSISALIEPHTLSSTAYIARPSRVIKIDAVALRGLFKKDRHMAYMLTYKVTKAAVERLYATRVQLAAAWA